MITIDKTHFGTKIVTKKGDVIKVQLAENQTTGYLLVSVNCTLHSQNPGKMNRQKVSV